MISHLGRLHWQSLYDVIGFCSVVSRVQSPSNTLRFYAYVPRLVDALHFVLTTHGVYDYTVTNYMNPLALTKIPW